MVGSVLKQEVVMRAAMRWTTKLTSATVAVLGPKGRTHSLIAHAHLHVQPAACLVSMVRRRMTQDGYRCLLRRWPKRKVTNADSPTRKNPELLTLGRAATNLLAIGREATATVLASAVMWRYHLHYNQCWCCCCCLRTARAHRAQAMRDWQSVGAKLNRSDCLAIGSSTERQLH